MEDSIHPVLMEYLNADNIENITSNEINTLNRHAITLDNSITYEVNTSTIFTDNELYPDPIYSPLKDKSWWQLNWKKAASSRCTSPGHCFFIAGTIVLTQFGNKKLKILK